MLPEDSRYQILKKLEANPEISQRQLATELGISLGTVNYCLRALADKGWVSKGLMIALAGAAVILIGRRAGKSA